MSDISDYKAKIARRGGTVQPYEVLARLTAGGAVGGLSVRYLSITDGETQESPPFPLPAESDPEFAAFSAALNAAAVAERDDLRTQLTAAVAAAVAERNDLQTQLAAAVAERDDLRTQLAAAAAEGDGLRTQLAAAVAERDAMAADLATRPPRPAARSVLPLAFLGRLPLEKQIAINEAGKVNPAIGLLTWRLGMAVEIDLDDPQIHAGVNALVSAGVLDAADGAALLA